jgi:hypothetical protein
MQRTHDGAPDVAGGPDDLPKHLEFIQDVIERHARTSFILKGWSVTLFAAVFVLAGQGPQSALTMAAGLLPAITFWGLDTYYLRQERLYRALYDKRRKLAPDLSDRFNLDASSFKSSVPSWGATLFAPSIFWFHVSVVLVVVGALAFFSLRPDYAS